MFLADKQRVSTKIGEDILPKAILSLQTLLIILTLSRKNKILRIILTYLFGN